MVNAAILLAIIVGADTEQLTGNKVDTTHVDELINRAFKVWPFHHADVEMTTLGKPGHLVSSRPRTVDGHAFKSVSKKTPYRFQASGSTTVEIDDSVCSGQLDTMTCVFIGESGGAYDSSSRLSDPYTQPMLLLENPDGEESAATNQTKKKKPKKKKMTAAEKQIAQQKAQEESVREFMRTLSMGKSPGTSAGAENTEAKKQQARKAFQDLKEHLEEDATGAAVPAALRNEQWDQLLGAGNVKKLRCSVCTRPLNEQEIQEKKLVCHRC
eukprot:gnl/MRDRNA2_/MRDRNA2_24823_c0_seq1.p1 gnl/MRDRNA2_/MRDRNA2_24823_c0~~gnl/MRDRNA2_/MRDRNA2_24823_c0_seq1.p1  ORF type:complete len:269 (+),score=61.97 gnl/MRDRNA2_/MRDRNA2_24823_c0_seq1:55-861(+)